MTLRYVGQYSGYLPEETGQVVAFVREKGQFVLNDYIQWVDAPTPLGLYKRYDRDQFVRLTAGGDMNRWDDGDERPKGIWNKLREEWVDFRTQRMSFDWHLGYKAIENVKNFSLKPAHMAMATSQAMTELTNRAIVLLETATNWPASNTLTAVAAANLGFTGNPKTAQWNNAGDDPSVIASYNVIFLGLTAAAERINLMTNARVKPADLRVLVSPAAARLIAASGEITNYVRESPVAREVLEKGLDPQYTQWGLPSMYKGFQFVVEDAPIVDVKPVELVTEQFPVPTTPAGLTGPTLTGRRRIKSDDSAIIVSRQGGLDGEFGTPSFSTIQAYHYGSQLEVEAFDDPENRVVRGHITTDVAVELAAPVAGFLITDILL